MSDYRYVSVIPRYDNPTEASYRQQDSDAQRSEWQRIDA